MSAKDETPRLRVFLCHASPDKFAVRELYRKLQVDGVDAWLDEKNIMPGQNWHLEISRALRGADVILVCLSPKSINKPGYVQKEIKAALQAAEEKPDGMIFIIPVKLQECGIPESLSHLQGVNLVDEQGYAELIRALRSCAAQCGRRPLSVADREEDSLPEYFTNRKDLCSRLENAAAGSQPHAKRVCMLQGEVGAGKSAVLRMLYLYCKDNGIPAVLISARYGITEIQLLRQLAKGLEQYNIEFSRFNSVWELFQASSEMGKELVHQTFEPTGASVRAPDLTPSDKTSTETDANSSVSLLLSTLRMTSQRVLALDPLTQLTDEFVHAVNHFADSARVVLLLDRYEEMANLDSWLCSWLRRLSTQTLVVIAGQQFLNTIEWDHVWPDWLFHLQVERLQPLTEGDRSLLVRRFSKMMCVEDLRAEDVDEIVSSAGNTPLSLELEVLMRSWGYRGPGQTSPDQLDTIVNSLLRGMRSELLPVAEAAAILRSPDPELLRAIVGIAHAERNIGHVAPLRFLVAKSNALRNIMNNYLKLRNRERYRTLHQKASEYYRKRASDLESLKPSTVEDQKERQRAELECLYHQFQLAEVAGMEEFRRLFEISFVARQELDFCRSLINEARGCAVESPSIAWLRVYEVLLNIRVGKDVAESKQILLGLMDQTVANRPLRTGVLESLATVHWLQDSTDEAKKIYEECLASFASLPEDLPGKVRALIGLGRLYKRTGTADAILLDAQEVCRRLNDQATSALVERELGDALRLQGRFREADELLTHSVEIYERLHFDFEEAHSLRIRAMLLVYLGKFREADRLFEKSMGLFETSARVKLRMYESVWTNMGRGDAALGRRQFPQAENLYTQALQLCADSEFETSVLQGCLADLYCAEKAWERSLVCAELSLTLRKKHDDQFGIAWASYAKGIALLQTSHFDEAFATLREGLKVAEQYHSFFLESKLTLGLCELFYRTREATKFHESALLVHQWAEQFGYFDHSARVNILESFFLMNEMHAGNHDSTLGARATEGLVKGLTDALKFSIVLLDSTVRDICESPAWLALDDSDKLRLSQLLENRWMRDVALVELESHERIAEYGWAKREPTMIQSLCGAWIHRRDRGATV